MTAQQVVAQKIKPGKSVGKVKLGMSMDAFKAIVGQPQEIASYEQERDAYISSGYETDKEAPFYLGFDKALMYDNSPNSKASIAVYRAFFKDDKLVYVILTSYGFDEDLYGNLKMKKGIKMKTPYANIMDAFGMGFISSKTSEQEFQTDYLREGISFAIDEYEVRAIHIYKPFTAEQNAEFRKRF